jgi:hypothetical protein
VERKDLNTILLNSKLIDGMRQRQLCDGRIFDLWIFVSCPWSASLIFTVLNLEGSALFGRGYKALFLLFLQFRHSSPPKRTYGRAAQK